MLWCRNHQEPVWSTSVAGLQRAHHGASVSRFAASQGGTWHRSPYPVLPAILLQTAAIPSQRALSAMRQDATENDKNYDRRMAEHGFSGSVQFIAHGFRIWQSLPEFAITEGSSSIGSSSFQLQVRCSSCSCERPLFKMTSLSEETAMMLRTSWQEVQVNISQLIWICQVGTSNFSLGARRHLLHLLLCKLLLQPDSNEWQRLPRTNYSVKTFHIKISLCITVWPCLLHPGGSLTGESCA